jgi:Protein of unknown function (DUF3298)
MKTIFRSLLFLGLFCQFGFSMAQVQNADYFHKRFEGSIDNIAAVMEITRDGSQISGQYCYTKVGLPIYMEGKIEKNGKFKMNEFDAGNDPTGAFEGQMNGNQLSGTWVNAAGAGKTNFNMSESYPVGSTKFDAFFLEAGRKHFPQKDGSPTAKLKILYLHPSVVPNPSVLGKIQTYFSNSCFKPEDNAKAGQKKLEAFRDRYFLEHKTDLSSVAESDLMEAPDRYTYDKTIEYTILFNESNLLSFSKYEDQSTGGEGGEANEVCHVLDMNTGEKINLKDVLLPNYQAALSAMLEKQIRFDREIPVKLKLSESEDQFTVEKIPVTDNFYLDRGGLGFYYAAGEIAPTAAGPIVVHIAYFKLKSLLNMNHAAIKLFVK